MFRKNGKHLYLTKGDNNNVDDRALYPEGQFWIEETDIIGRVRG
jgi:signal peptidase